MRGTLYQHFSVERRRDRYFFAHVLAVSNTHARSIFQGVTGVTNEFMESVVVYATEHAVTPDTIFPNDQSGARPTSFDTRDQSGDRHSVDEILDGVPGYIYPAAKRAIADAVKFIEDNTKSGRNKGHILTALIPLTRDSLMTSEEPVEAPAEVPDEKDMSTERQLLERALRQDTLSPILRRDIESVLHPTKTVTVEITGSPEKVEYTLYMIRERGVEVQDHGGFSWGERVRIIGGDSQLMGTTGVIEGFMVGKPGVAFVVMDGPRTNKSAYNVRDLAHT